VSTYRVVLERYEQPPADQPHRRRWRQVAVSGDIDTGTLLYQRAAETEAIVDRLERELDRERRQP
jgi:hypothetical protein